MNKPAIICIAIEAVAFLIGVALCYFFSLPWWIAPLCLLAPPVIAIVLGVLFFADATSNGGNPFR
jgi:tetrahydromethanopterin S-methyltransferase subunit C